MVEESALIDHLDVVRIKLVEMFSLLFKLSQVALFGCLVGVGHI